LLSCSVKIPDGEQRKNIQTKIYNKKKSDHSIRLSEFHVCHPKNLVLSKNLTGRRTIKHQLKKSMQWRNYCFVLFVLKKTCTEIFQRSLNVNRPPKSNRNVVFHQESGCKDRNFFNPIQNIRAYFCKKNA
jgi:hypothetical protein